MIKTDNLQITPRILSIISEIEEFKGAWCALGTLALGTLINIAQNGYN